MINLALAAMVQVPSESTLKEYGSPANPLEIVEPLKVPISLKVRSGRSRRRSFSTSTAKLLVRAF
jgi:hypothetical protein